MAMRSSGTGSGGGIGSRNVTKQSPRNGAPAREMRPKGVSQIGSSMGNHATDSGRILRGAVEPVRGARVGGVPLGNEVAMNVGKGGPGAGRAVFANGSQGRHGRPKGSPPPAGRDILSAFGPESGSRQR